MHHFVYVIALEPTAIDCIDVLRIANRNGIAAPRSILYVGMTGVPVEKRFKQHKLGIMANKMVQRYGTHVAHTIGPLSFDSAGRIESLLAIKLMNHGHLVIQS